MDPQREFARYNSKIIECSSMRLTEKKMIMKNFHKPMKYLTIYMGYKYEKFLCQNILLFRNSRMENVWPILVRSIVMKILAF